VRGTEQCHSECTITRKWGVIPAPHIKPSPLSQTFWILSCTPHRPSIQSTDVYLFWLKYNCLYALHVFGIVDSTHHDWYCCNRDIAVISWTEYIDFTVYIRLHVLLVMRSVACVCTCLSVPFSLNFREPLPINSVIDVQVLLTNISVKLMWRSLGQGQG